MDRVKVKQLIILTTSLIIASAIGLSNLEGISVPEGFYYSTLTVLTHFPHGPSTNWMSKILVLGEIIFSIVVTAYLIKELANYIIGIDKQLAKRKMTSKIKNMKNHYIICGLGRVGIQVAQELLDEGVDFVAMDRNPERVDSLIKLGGIALELDSTDETSLKKAGLDHAIGVIAALGEDAENMFVVLNARQDKPDIFVVARASKIENYARLEKAGADRVIMPDKIGGYHMATVLLRPDVVDVLDILSTNKSRELQIEELLIDQNSGLLNINIATFNKKFPRINILAITGADGSSKVSPQGNMVIKLGDKLILMAHNKDLSKLS
jgi:voltage-gated potassium channel